jgi:hypothetical protein
LFSVFHALKRFKSVTAEWSITCYFMREMSRASINIVVLATLGIWAAAPLWPVTLQQLTSAQMTSASTAIVRGTISGSYTALSGKTIFTHYTVQVSETWKGTPVTTADVALPGGALKGVRQSFPGVPVLQMGQEYLLFLWTGSTGPTQLTGLTQGALAIESDISGQLMVARRATGEIMLNSLGRPISDQAVLMPLASMRATVSAALGSNLGSQLGSKLGGKLGVKQ